MELFRVPNFKKKVLSRTKLVYAEHLIPMFFGFFAAQIPYLKIENFAKFRALAFLIS
jgi:hypothetical protein